MQRAAQHCYAAVQHKCYTVYLFPIIISLSLSLIGDLEGLGVAAGNWTGLYGSAVGGANLIGASGGEPS